LAKKTKSTKPAREYSRRQLSKLQRQKRRQRFIFIGGITIIVAVVVIVIAGWVFTDYIPWHQTVMKINDTNVSMRYYVDSLKLAYLSAKNQNQDTSLAQLLYSLPDQIQKDELIKQAAEKLGITVSDKEATDALKNVGAPVNDSNVKIEKTQMVLDKLRSNYFGPQVPESDNQVNAMMMMLESDSQAQEIRQRLLNGENFTTLAPEFALNYYSKNVNNGDFGWHPEDILMLQTGTSIPLDYAFSGDIGSLSQPLSDNETYKQLGYWLLKVNGIKPATANMSASANVSGVLLSSEEQAEEIRARLEAGEDLGPIADQYSGYSTSKENHGEMNFIPESDSGNVTAAFNSYVFNPDTQLGVWSEPIQEPELWTQGGSWLVQINDRSDNRTLSTDDRNTLIENMLNDWVSAIQSDSTNNIENLLTDELQQWAIIHAQEELKLT
jgi:parvulin-like peptidyl-prolyl isomerase